MTHNRITAGIFGLGVAIGLLASAPAAIAADLEKGKTSYTTYCVTCHGEKGDGKGVVGVTLQPPPRDFSGGQFNFDTDKDGKTGTHADIGNVIKNGAAAYGGSPLMTPWPLLQGQDLDDVIAYIRTLSQGEATAADTGAGTP